ncbi:hypothetical protein Tco_1106052 [Tanacetum coccineum]
MMALTEVEQDDWSMEFDAEHVHFGQDGLGDFDWSNKADDTPVSLALMATNSEVPYCSKCSKSYKKLLESYQTERDNFQRARTEILGYQMSLESLEVILKTHEKNEYAWGDKYEQMEYDLKIRDSKLEEKQKELDQALKERDDFKDKLEKWSNASVLQNEVLNKQRYVSDKSCIGFGVESSSSMDSENTSRNTNSSESSYPNFQKAKGFHSVPPPTGTIIPPRANVSFTGIDELAIRNKVLNQENTKTSQPEIDRNKVIIEDWVDSDDEETVLNSSEIQKKTVLNSENSETSFENRYPHQRRSFIPSAVLTREGLKSTARPKLTRTVPSKSTANVFYQGVTLFVAKATKDEGCLMADRTIGACQLSRTLTNLACRKGKQHRASCKKIKERTVREPLELLHMDLFGPVSVESVNRKKKQRRHKVKTNQGVTMEQISKNQLMHEFVQEKESRENIALQGLHSKMVSQKERIGLSLKLLELC